MAKKEKDAHTVHRSGSDCRVAAKQGRREVATAWIAGKAPKAGANIRPGRDVRMAATVQEPLAVYGDILSPPPPPVDGLPGGEVQQSIRQIKAGLPMACFDALREALDITQERLAAVAGIPARTLARRRQEGRFRPDEGERVLRLARVLEDVLRLFEGDAAAARRWMETPQDLFEGRTPLEYCDTEPGAGFVRDVAGRLEHGVFS
jgi:putative toxin-antitoxin system antitoxin component (TIGR02293 family)